MSLVRPFRLDPGDRVRIVAPSGPVDRERFESGLAVLAQRYEPVFDETAVYSRTGFLAGDDRQRLASLHEALADDSCRALFMARGGYGLMRLLPSIDSELLLSNPKPIIGFSDSTALLALCAKSGMVSIHGPVVSQLGALPSGDVEALFGLLESDAVSILLDGLIERVPGRVDGPLLGGNLEMVSRLIGTPFQLDLADAILFIEDVNERPYKIDRLLTHLELAGALDRVRGIVIGELVGCDEEADGAVCRPSSDDVIADRLDRLGIPWASGAPFGHGSRNRALPYGARVVLDTVAGTLTALEPAVS